MIDTECKDYLKEKDIGKICEDLNQLVNKITQLKSNKKK